MGLKLSKEVQDTGIFVEYWKISEIVYNSITGGGRISLVGYKDKASRDANKNPLSGKMIQFAENSGPMLHPTKNSVAASYDLVKEDPFFTGAIDG